MAIYQLFDAEGNFSPKIISDTKSRERSSKKLHSKGGSHSVKKWIGRLFFIPLLCSFFSLFFLSLSFFSWITALFFSVLDLLCLRRKKRWREQRGRCTLWAKSFFLISLSSLLFIFHRELAITLLLSYCAITLQRNKVKLLHAIYSQLERFSKKMRGE